MAQSDRLAACARDRQEAGAAPATIRNELHAPRQAFGLAKRAGEVASDPEFPHLTGWRLPSEALPLMWDRAGFRRRAALPRLKALLLRQHEHATEVTKRSGRLLPFVFHPEHTALKLTGHQTRDVFDRYDLVSERDLSDGVARLARFHAAVAASS